MCTISTRPLYTKSDTKSDPKSDRCWGWLGLGPRLDPGMIGIGLGGIIAKGSLGKY